MASTFEQAKVTGCATILPTSAVSAETYQAIFEGNRHRIYALAFWMTDNELSAEQMMHNVFCRAFAHAAEPSHELLDRALIAEIRELMPVGVLTLDEGVCTETPSVRRNTLRVHLERAVVQLPATERLVFLLHDVEGYDHERIARTLGLTLEESQHGLHQARLNMRKLLATMKR